MSLIKSLNSAVSGLQTISKNFGVVSDNVSNANNENYSRRVLYTEDDPNGGVRVAAIRRQTNEIMQRNYRSSLAQSEASRVRNALYSEIADVLGSSTGNSNLNTAINAFISGWRELQTAPENEAVAFKIESVAKEMASLIRNVSSELELIRQEVAADVQTAVMGLNNNVARIDKLNTLVISQGVSSSARSGFENERDRVIDEVARVVDVTVQKNADGTVSIYTKTGITLVSGFANSFTWDSTTQRLDSNLSSRNLIDELPEGSLRAQIQLIKNYADVSAGLADASDPNISPLQKLQDQLDGLAHLFVKPSSATKLTTFAGAFGAAFDSPKVYPGDNIPGASPYVEYWQQQLFVPNDIKEMDVQDITASNFYVNTNLVQNLRILARRSPQVATIVTNLTSRTRDLNLSSLSVKDQNYESVAKAIQVNFSVRNERVYSVDKANQASATKARSSYRSEVGVSLDQEMARIAVLQNSYVATAKIISTVNNMFSILDRVI
ncbi:MAG: flagellar hook-associated protein FlgK [Alphaproteobacteria bacterium]|nr:flagellar hook-associated protein FlgK [Alphaproteobacteria bacterium]